jgi:hypothetical protein
MQVHKYFETEENNHAAGYVILENTSPSPGRGGISAGYGSTDLRLYTFTKRKVVNYWLYSPMYKK